MEKTIRANVSFTFDPGIIREQSIKDRLDLCIERAFPGSDVHTRWVSEMAGSPQFGIAHIETERPDQMKFAAGQCGGADRVAGVARDDGLEERDAEHPRIISGHR